jgi:hypothetical protein
VGTDGTSQLVANTVLQVVGSQYIQKENTDVALFVNAVGGGPIVAFSKNGISLLEITNSAINLATTTIFNKKSLIGDGGGNSGAAVDVTTVGFNHIEISPRSDAYYNLVAGQLGQVIAVVNMSEQTPYVGGAVSIYIGYHRPGPRTAMMLICDSSANWSKIT